MRRRRYFEQCRDSGRTHQPRMISLGDTFLCSSYMFLANSISTATCKAGQGRVTPLRRRGAQGEQPRPALPHPRTRCAARRSSWSPPPSACPRCLRGEGAVSGAEGVGGRPPCPVPSRPTPPRARGAHPAACR